ncbi:MAG: glutathione peroxidase [Actinomycetota bacterium]
MGIHGIGVRTIDGEESTLEPYRGRTLLVVNVASRCGFTPQYEGLQQLQDRYGERGLTVLGFPCNQFAGQEPGTHEEIREFCSLNYGVAFPLFEKVDVNGEDRHPLFAELTAIQDTDGKSGDVMWNFEKFVVSPEGEVVGRFRTQVTPTSDEITAAIEEHLP